MKYAVAVIWLLAWISLPARADLETGLTLFEQGNYEAAAEELLPTAEDGDPRAQYILGVIFVQGLTGEADPEAGAAWLKRSAGRDYVQAQVELARMYRTGDGIPQDFAEMATWYRRAAELGDVGAQLFVADAYAYGQGVEQDLVEAYVWYEVAMRYWGHLAQHAREAVASQLSETEIAEAKTRAAAITTPSPVQ